jgi:hypothetical protein
MPEIVPRWPAQASRTAERGGLWQSPRNAQILPVVASQPMDQNIAAPTAKVTEIAPKSFAGAGITNARAM